MERSLQKWAAGLRHPVVAKVPWNDWRHTSTIMSTSTRVPHALNRATERAMPVRTESEFLDILHGRGATRLRHVRFKANRSTIWSLTQGGLVLNLHLAYRKAPRDVVHHFATIARYANVPTKAYRNAAAAVRTWDGLQTEMERLRREYRRERLTRPRTTGRRCRLPRTSGPCCATEEQTEYLRRLYRYLNRERFGGRLPVDVTLRLSSRMKSRLGQMVPSQKDGVRQVVEIALNVDLMLEGNGRERTDTMVHEMAHVAAWLFDGGVDHGPSWRKWARHAGCRATASAPGPIRRRAAGIRQVTRVPPLPERA